MIAHVNLLSTGQGIFEDLYELDASGKFHVLKKHYHRTDATLWAGHEITPALMGCKYFSGTELCSGRLLKEQGMLAMKNIKKAYSFTDKYLDKAGNPKLSGWDEDQVIKAVAEDMMALELNVEKKSAIELEADALAPNLGDPEDEKDMAYYLVCGCGNDSAACGVCGLGYACKQARGVEKGIGAFDENNVFHLKLKASDSGQPGEDQDKASPTSSKKPTDQAKPKPLPGTRYHGEMAFIYFGPFASNKEAGRDLDLLALAEPTKAQAKKLGRKAAREEKLKAEEFERDRDANRGMSTMERIQMAMLAQQDEKSATVMHKAQIFSLQCNADRHVKMTQVYQNCSNHSGFQREEAAYIATTQKILALEDEMESVRKACAAHKRAGKKRRSFGQIFDDELAAKEKRVAEGESDSSDGL